MIDLCLKSGVCLPTLQDALSGEAQFVGHRLSEVRGGGCPEKSVRHALNELERQNPVGLVQQRHVEEAQRVAEQTGVEDLHVAEARDQLMHEKVGGQLAHMIDHTGNAVEGRRAAEILQMPEQECEHEADADAHEPDDEQEGHVFARAAYRQQTHVL